MEISKEKRAEFRKILGQVAGPLPTDMDTALANEDMQFARGMFAEAHASARLAHSKVGALGKAQAALEQWGRSVGLYDDEREVAAAPAKPNDGLPPGFRIGNVGDTSDVGDPNGKGTIPIASLTAGNLEYYTSNNLAPRWAQYFSGSLDALNARIGARAGDLSNAVPDPIVRDDTGNVIGDLSQPPSAPR